MNTELAAYQAAIETAKTELARLRTDLDGLRAKLSEAQKALDAERAAREIAEARLYAYGDHQPHCPLHSDLRGICTCGYATITSTTPAVIAELAAARAVIKVVRWAVENHYAPPPLCDALIAYDGVTKATA